MSRGRISASLLWCCVAFACAPAEEQRPDVLLITVDTLRADHVGAYGHRAPTTPTLDALASRGVRFADATVQTPKTWPSLGSLLTGTYPATNGVRYHQHFLADRNSTLAEIFGAAGYRTAAVVANVNVGRQFGFAQGFEHFVESWVEALLRETGRETFENAPGVVKRYTGAATVTRQALEWARGLSDDRPYFLWLHYMDPHGPFDPPAEQSERFAPYHPAEPVDWQVLPPYQRRYDAETGLMIADLGVYKSRYDGEIRVFDDALAALLEGLDALGRERPRIVALTADHGESLGEHDYYLEHGKLPYQPTARVPLVLVAEGRLPAGTEVSAPVGLVDLAPTLLALADLPAAGSFQGAALPGIGAGDEARPVFMESGYHQPYTVAVRRGRWKLVRARAPQEREMLGDVRLFDLDADPGEQRDLARDRPEIVRELSSLLQDWLDETPELETDPGERALDPGTREMLEALGYGAP